MIASLKRLLLAAALLCASPAFAVTASLTGYVGVTNGVDPRTQQTFSTPAGETGQINVAVHNMDGSAYDLTGAQLLLTVKDRNNAIIISRQGTINLPSTLGTAYFPLVVADTVGLSSFGAVAYSYDVWVTDSSGNRWAAVITSVFSVTRAQGQPAQPVTVPATQTPLAPGNPALAPTVTKTGAYTAKCNDLVVGDPTGGAFVITLPAANGTTQYCNAIVVKDISTTANALTLTPAGADTIDGISSWALSARESLRLMSNGVNGWMVW
jgi:hypothetical protein